MSHFSVAVIHRCDTTIEEMLAPYDENIGVAPYVRFTRQEAIDYARKNYDGYADRPDSECYDAVAEDYIAESMVDEEGNLYSRYNPNSKFDWYCVGGRFSGLLKTKDGEECDDEFIRELDFSPDKDAHKRALRFWDVVVDHAPLAFGEQQEDFRTIYSEDYFREYYKTRENYANIMSSFSTYAVITPNGVWHGKGEMGWWGFSSENPEEFRKWHETYMERFINHTDPYMKITIVDCHI